MLRLNPAGLIGQGETAYQCGQINRRTHAAFRRFTRMHVLKRPADHPPDRKLTRR